jgi:hypothetical protein
MEPPPGPDERPAEPPLREGPEDREEPPEDAPREEERDGAEKDRPVVRDALARGGEERSVRPGFEGGRRLRAPVPWRMRLRETWLELG